jgi:hypothetical protein
MQYIQLQSQNSGTIPTPSSGSFNLFLDSIDDTLKIKNQDGVIPSSINVSNTTYLELVDGITGSTLYPGNFYLITDFKTCYDQPDYDYNQNAILTGNYKQSSVDPIIVFATSTNSISSTAYQPSYPNDKIQYDWSFNKTEVTNGVAYGRISERIDEFNNRTDYDHRTIQFKRYQYFEIDFNSPYQGTVDVTPTTEVTMNVDGTNTLFTNLTIGEYVGFKYNNDFKVYEITSISGNTLMTITGLTNTNTNSGVEMFPAYSQTNTSYYQNNITTAYTEYYTFDYNNNNLNNYIGDYTNLYVYNENSFILANNVFLGSTYINNTFGNACYNNSFDDDCENNTIGNYFYNNITDDDFDGNIIGNWFNNNRITSNFQYNRIGENFQYNYLIQNSFYRNNIMNYFNNNIISGGDFQNNEIGNQFNNNVIRNGQFYKNDIGNGYNYNKIYSDFYGNLIGNGFNANNLYCTFYENTIGEIYTNNVIGDINNPSTYEFHSNKIGNDFTTNEISGQTNNNVIGNRFENNTILYDFNNNQIFNEFKGNITYQEFYFNKVDWGFSGNEFSGNCGNNTFGPYTLSNDFLGNVFANTLKSNSYGNVIGDNFIGNNIGENFYNNNISDGFQYNQIGLLFNNNTIGDNFGYGYTEPQGNKIGNNFYNNTVGEYFYNNSIADNFYSVTIRDHFQSNIINTKIIETSLSSSILYSSTTVNLFTNSNNDLRLSYFDDMDVLNVESIDASFTITSFGFGGGIAIDTDTTPLGVNGTSGFTNTASQNSLYDGYYGQGLGGTSLSQLTTAYNNLGLSLSDNVGRLWYVTWGSGSTISSGVVKFGSYVNSGSFDIQTIDTTDPDYLTPNNGNGTSLVGTFLFPATFTIFDPITNKDTWC